MNTSFRHAFMLMTAAVVTALSLASCGGEDEPDEPEIDVSVKAYKFIYTAQASPDMLQFFDIQVTYTDGAGATRNLTLDSKGFFTDTVAVTEDKLASVYEYKVVGKARQGTAIDPGKTYNLTAETWFEREVRNPGKTEWRPLARKPKWKKYENIAARDLEGILKSLGDEFTVADITYTTVVGI